MGLNTSNPGKDVKGFIMLHSYGCSLGVNACDCASVVWWAEINTNNLQHALYRKDLVARLR